MGHSIYKKCLPIILLFGSSSNAETTFNITQEGKAAASGLKIKSSLVPTFEIYQKKVVNGKTETFKVKNIPALNVGSEKKIEATNLADLDLPSSRSIVLSPVQRHSPIKNENFNLDKYNKLEAALPAKSIIKLDQSQELLPLPKTPDITALTVEVNKIQLLTTKEMNPNDYKLLQALIFLEIQKQYEMAMGLLAELFEDPQHRIEAMYNYAMTAKGVGLNSEFRSYMIKVIKESKSQMWEEKATTTLVKNMNLLEKADIALLDPLVDKFKLDVSNEDEFQIARAKYYSDLGKLESVTEALINITEKSPKYLEALFLKALLNYRQAKFEEAIYSLDQILEKTDFTKQLPIRSLAALTLARIQFQQSRYKEAFQTYLKIDKTNSLWLQAMIESSWTQILAEDYEGAAGNMFSLHTDFFKNSFLPESYVVRTVGYLNLCQYGDGAQVLQEMQKKFTPWRKKLDSYKTQSKETIKYYDTVKSWLKNSDLKEIDGLPRNFIVELATDPGFLNTQKQINNLEDEITRINKIALSLVKIEKDALARKNLAQQEVLQIKRKTFQTNQTEQEIEVLQLAEKKLLSYGIQYHIANKARLTIKNIRTSGLSRIESEKSSLRQQAAAHLQKHFTTMSANLSKFLDQIEVLKYELYAGAGEHIRYQLAGGDINSKEHPELKVQDEKSLNWKFKGEFWEDEVGHYRSSLKNVCPQEPSIAGNSN